MRYRIIKTHGCKTCKELLIFIDRDDDGDYIQLLAWHEDGNSGLTQKGKIIVDIDENITLTLQRMLSDFSELSANEFVNSFEL